MFVSPAVRAATEADIDSGQQRECDRLNTAEEIQACIDKFAEANRINKEKKAKESGPPAPVRCDIDGVVKKCQKAYTDAQNGLMSDKGEREKDYLVSHCFTTCSSKASWVTELIQDCGNLGQKKARERLDEMHGKCSKQGSLQSKKVVTEKGAYVVPCTDSTDCMLKENEIKDPDFVAEKRVEASPWTFGLAQGQGVYDPETGAVGYEYSRESTSPGLFSDDGGTEVIRDEAKGREPADYPRPPTCEENPRFCPASVPPADGGTNGRETPARETPVAEERPARETPSRSVPAEAEPQVAKTNEGQTNSGSNGSSSGGSSGGTGGGFPGGTSGGSSTSGFASNPYNPNLLSSSEMVSNRGGNNGGSEVTSNGGSSSGGSSSGGSSGRSRGFGDRRGDNNTPEAAANLSGTAVASNRGGGLSSGGGSAGERERGTMVASVDRSAPLLQGAKYYRGSGAKPLGAVKPKVGKKPVRTRKKLPLDPSTMRASLVKRCNGNTQCVLTVMGMSNQKLMVYRASDRGIASDFSLRGRDRRIPAEVGYGTHDVISAVNRMVDHFQLDEEGDIDYGDEY